MNTGKQDLKCFYSFPPALKGALRIVPYFQVFLYLPFLLQSFGREALGVTMAAHLLLYPLFFNVFWCRGYRAAFIAIILTVLAVMVSFYSISCIGFFAFAAAACSACRQKMVTLILLLGVTMAYLLSAYLNYHSLYIILVGLFFTAINGPNFYIQFRKYCSDRTIKQTQVEVTNIAKIAERERIARDLHDLLGHSLTSITLKAELVERLFDIDPVLAKQHIADIEKISRTALTQVRDTVTEYKKNTLENELTSARVALESKDIELIDNIPANIDIDQQLNGVLAMIVREATTNILRHSTATRCKITLEQQQAFLRLRIGDNGKALGEVVLGNGIKGMAERFEALGGNLSVQFTSGCHINATLPLSKAIYKAAGL
ncbi:sensor histidine kinase [Microbulbifer sp. OS29]|uniref:Sensor histidine kinase n=1 Tax=Microbulbifer okhotskensis TaxID=2926617 RepID=A0A9X2EQ87_9GAMM|nr:sensor histidine kinase [Microbulbifer okhotskensis]MCO1336377.1 sensor histidine kinase [Microbulbifer okhotskensis]